MVVFTLLMKPFCLRRLGDIPCFNATHVSILTPAMSTGSMTQLQSICWEYRYP